MIQECISSSKAPKAAGPYSPALKVGDFIYVSGQLGTDAVTGEMGKTIDEQTHNALNGIKYLLDEMHLGFRHVVKTTVYLKNMSDFAKVNEIYASYFSAPYPARSCVEVSALPKGSLICIDCFIIDTLAEEIMNGECCCCDMDCKDCTDRD